MRAAVSAIEYCLPESLVTNDALAAAFPDWTPDKIREKTGIAERRVAAEGECASDLGVAAAKRLFASGCCTPESIDYLLFCTQSPDYFLPTTACLIQDRLRLRNDTGAVDFNLGCSGYVYGLSLAKGLIETGQAGNVLLVTAETYSKFMHPKDKSTRTLFGDGASATLIRGIEGGASDGGAWLGPFVFGTDGRGGENLIVVSGGLRNRVRQGDDKVLIDEDGGVRSPDYLFMNGPEIFTFTLRAVPQAIKGLLARAHLTLDEVDLFVFHQANLYILEHLRKKTKIPEGKFYICMEHCGNTVSSTIPIALKHAVIEGNLKPGHRVMLVGFGVGYSWGATLIRWYGGANRQ